MALRLGSDVSTATTEYGTVLLDQRTGEYWELNPTGTLVVRTLLQGGDEDDAVEALVAEFDIDRDRATRDVAELTEQLRTSGLAS
ncbi:lasso peptide biosynthesis PqqD family chaperone [Streptomyces sp. NPDC001407]|uniref:lasso peptide biosynthesis PqqD family chaperone n=1 Tax=Streptomyces sp. NPDC001407 TaxID=3364573 RepID=UPI00368181D5